MYLENFSVTIEGDLQPLEFPGLSQTMIKICELADSNGFINDSKTYHPFAPSSFKGETINEFVDAYSSLLPYVPSTFGKVKNYNLVLNPDFENIDFQNIKNMYIDFQDIKNMFNSSYTFRMFQIPIGRLVDWKLVDIQIAIYLKNFLLMLPKSIRFILFVNNIYTSDTYLTEIYTKLDLKLTDEQKMRINLFRSEIQSELKAILNTILTDEQKMKLNTKQTKINTLLYRDIYLTDEEKTKIQNEIYTNLDSTLKYQFKETIDTFRKYRLETLDTYLTHEQKAEIYNQVLTTLDTNLTDDQLLALQDIYNSSFLSYLDSTLTYR